MSFRDFLRSNWVGYALGFGTAAATGTVFGALLVCHWHGAVIGGALGVLLDCAMGRTSGSVLP